MRRDEHAVHSHVRELVAKTLVVAPSEIDDAELLANYGMSSIDLIDVVVKLESEYGIQFDPEKMKDLTCRALSDNVLASLAAA